MELVLIILIMLINALAIIGCILPMLPGPLLSFGTMLMINFLLPEYSFTYNNLITFGIITGAVNLLDYYLPIYTAKKGGTSKKGIQLGIVGMLVGLFFFPPFGFLLGTLAGTILGDMMGGKVIVQAMRSGVWSFVGFVIATLVKIAAVVAVVIYTFYHIGFDGFSKMLGLS